MTFFNTASPVLADANVRHALIGGADIPSIIKKLDYQTRAVNEPFLAGQLGYDKTYAQTSYDPASAASTLTQAGWVVGNDGIRVKAGKPLRFTLVGTDTPEAKAVTNALSGTGGRLVRMCK